jgi:hypothetical protein
MAAAGQRFLAIRGLGGGTGSAALALALALFSAETSALFFTAAADMSSGVLGMAHYRASARQEQGVRREYG